MGLWSKKNKLLGEYRILERYTQGLEKCTLIGETSEYKIYSHRYNWLTSPHLLRQEKKKPEKIVYLGSAHDNIAIYHDFVFSMNRFSNSPRCGYHPLFMTNIKTGERKEMPLLSEKTFHITGTAGDGRVHIIRTYCQDTVQRIYTEDNALFIKVLRHKENSENEEEFEYLIRLRYDGTDFRVKYYYPTDKQTEESASNPQIQP